MSHPARDRMIFTPVRRLFVAALVFDLAIAMIGLAVQFLGNSLGATPLVLGLLGMASPAAYALGCLFTGRLSDRIGRRLLATASCLICAAAWLVMTQVNTPLQLLAIIPVSGAAISLFWPPLQAWLSEIPVGGRRRLIANIGTFNISWTIGLMLGPPIAGLAWGLGPAAPFALAAAGVAGLLLLLQSVPTEVEGGGEQTPRDMERPRPDAAVARSYLHLAWIANFASWFGRGMNIVVFPKLASEMGMSERLIGIIIATYLAGQLLMFLYLRNRSGWQFRLWPLLAALGAGCLGWVIAWTAQSPPVFALSFIVCGMGAGVTYASSLFYSLEGQAVSRGARTGIHEAVLGSGVFLGPLFGGAIADWIGLQAPYLFTAGIFVCIAGALFTVWRAGGRPGAKIQQQPTEVTGE